MRPFAAEARGEQTLEGAADDAADEGVRRGDAVDGVGVGEVGPHEEGLEALFGTGDDGGVVAEQQAVEDGNEHDREEIGAAAFS